MKRLLSIVLFSASLQAAKKPCDPARISLDPACWVLDGWTLQPSAPDPGFWFQFPSPSEWIVRYLTTDYSRPMTGQISMTIQAQSLSGIPIYNYNLEPGNTCIYPAHVRLYFERRGDNGRKEFYRWWSVEPASYQLETGGLVTITAPLLPTAWSSVSGKRGDYDPSVTAEFFAATADPMEVGMTFGGGCFFGHGVNVSGGTAKFTVTGFAAQ